MPEQDGLLLIISGPSGVGKTTITHRVEQALDAVFSISMTTRPKTAEDQEGADYQFVSEDEFKKHRDNGEMLEWAQVFDNFYGTPRAPVEKSLAQGRVVILEIDVQGAIQVKQNMPEAFAVFVLPPSEEALLHRLRGRRREDEDTIQRRFAKAKDEIERAKSSGVYDVLITNDELNRAVDQTIAVVRAEMSHRAG